MLATAVHCMRGTPYIYQGEELGMTNAGFTRISQYRDVESLNHFRILQEKGLTEEDAYRILQVHSRDNSRTPMQWSDGEQGGFTEGTPWIEVNPNYRVIHAAGQLEDEDSVFHYYQRLIQMRKELDVIAYGEIAPLDERHPSVLAYERTYGRQSLLVICNFYGRETAWKGRQDLEEYQRILGNYPEGAIGEALTLRPYECLVLYREREREPT